jgi:hypothetical protein
VVAPPPPVAPTPPVDTAPKISDEQKAKLLALDKEREEKAKAHKKERAGAAAKHGPAKRYKSQGFTTGGNKFDPLNANL